MTDKQHDTELHDMGGDIGPASIRGSEEPIGGRPDDDAAPRSGYAQPTRAGQEDARPGTTGAELGTPAAHQSSNPADVTATPETALDEDAPVDEYVEIDPEPAHPNGGADGEWDARLEQKCRGGP